MLPLTPSQELEGEVFRLLEESGKPLTLESSQPGTYDPATGVSAVATSIKRTVRGFFLTFRNDEAPNTSHMMGDRKCIISSREVNESPIEEPSLQDVIVDEDDVRWTIVQSMRQYEYNGRPFCYVLQVRRAVATR